MCFDFLEIIYTEGDTSGVIKKQIRDSSLIQMKEYQGEFFRLNRPQGILLGGDFQRGWNYVEGK